MIGTNPDELAKDIDRAVKLLLGVVPADARHGGKMMRTRRRLLFSRPRGRVSRRRLRGHAPGAAVRLRPQRRASSGMGTYAWYADPTFVMPHGDSVIDGHFIDSAHPGRVDADLAKKGYQKVDAEHATMFVAYRTGDTGVGDRGQVRQLRVG